MDSLDKTPETTPLDVELVPPLPPRIHIVRDGILAFLVATAITLGIVVVIFVAGTLVGSVSLNATTFSLPPILWVVMLIAQGVPLLGVAWFLRWKYKSSGHLLPALLEGSFGSSALVGIVAGLVMAGFGTLHAIVATALFGKASTEAMEELMRQLLAATGDPAVLSGLVICIAILVPICEEFFFRGALFSSVRSGQSARAAAITSSVLFAVAHLNPMMFTYYLVFGFTMCWLLTRTRTIVAPMAAHITVNSTATIAMLLSSSTGN